MATGGETYKSGTREWHEARVKKLAATRERKKNASLKQRTNWRKFRMNGAIGFAQGGLASSINRLQALIDELPVGHHLRYDIARTIHKIKVIHDEVRMLGNSSMQYAEEAEAQLMEWEGL